MSQATLNHPPNFRACRDRFPARASSARSRSASWSTPPPASAAKPARWRASNGTAIPSAKRFSQHLPDHAGDGVELLEPDQVQRARARRRQHDAADAQGPVHALRRAGLPGGLPGRRRHRAIYQRHRRFPAGQLHRLRVLRDRMSVQHSEVQPAHQEDVQVYAVLRPRGRGAGAGLHQSVPHRLSALRHQGRHEGVWPKRAPRSFASTTTLPTPAFTIRRAWAARASSTCCTT